MKVMASEVIQDTAQSAPNHPYNTRQPPDLYLPTIKTNALFNSFWPRTTRDIRGETIDHQVISE